MYEFKADPVVQQLVTEEWRLSAEFEFAKKFPYLIDEEVACKFWALVHQTEDCWYWTGTLDGGGYGIFQPIPSGRRYLAREVAMLDVGHECPSPEFEVDQLCNNHSCVNPAHLEWVTHAENVKRQRARRVAQQRFAAA